uniref:Uncharacterized protein n=1 Tax=Lotus japonicus TaxID=34305 RepID=I3T6Y2_LOTJA|nr:unknown [Lotus japonicus]
MLLLPVQKTHLSQSSLKIMEWPRGKRARSLIRCPLRIATTRCHGTITKTTRVPPPPSRA